MHGYLFAHAIHRGVLPKLLGASISHPFSRKYLTCGKLPFSAALNKGLVLFSSISNTKLGLYCNIKSVNLIYSSVFG